MKNVSYLKAKICQLVMAADKAIDEQLNLIYENSDFSQLQSMWASLRYLTSIISRGRNCSIRLLDLKARELIEDIQQKAALQYTTIYNLIYHREFDTQGGTPFGLLVVNHPVNPLGKQARSHLYLVSAMGRIGQDAQCPVIFPLDDQWLEPETDRIAFIQERLLRIYNSTSLNSYRALRSQPQSLYVGLVWPSAHLTRGGAGLAADWADNCRISGAMCLAACVAKDYDLYGWFAGLQCWGAGEEGGAVVPAPKGTNVCARLQFSESLEQFYSKLGIMLLSSTWLEGLPGLFSQTMLRRFSDPARQQAEKSEEPLSWLLMACRVAHYLKVILREYVGQVLLPEKCRQLLDSWLQRYCLTSKIMTHESISKYPFNKARVRVATSPIDETHMTITLELSPNLPPGMVSQPLSLRLIHKRGGV